MTAPLWAQPSTCAWINLMEVFIMFNYGQMTLAKGMTTITFGLLMT
jgi:hypothetical protein